MHASLRLCNKSWVIVVGITLLQGGGSVQARDQKEDAKAIYAAAENAVSRRLVEKTRMLGFSIEKSIFSDMPPEGAVLIGFDLGVGKFMDIDSVYAIRAVYRTEDGEASYNEHGLFRDKHATGKRIIKTKVVRTEKIRARPGYAVGAMTIRSGLNINGLCVMFMRITGTTLDPNQSYESDWIGDRTGGSEAKISGDGAPVVGVFGNKDQDHVMALGLIYIREARRAAAPATAPAPVAEKRRAPEPEKPRAEPRARTARSSCHRAGSACPRQIPRSRTSLRFHYPGGLETVSHARTGPNPCRAPRALAGRCGALRGGVSAGQGVARRIPLRPGPGDSDEYGWDDLSRNPAHS